MSRSLTLATLIALALASAGATSAAAGASGLKVTARIAGPDGGWDYASFHAGALYVTHGQLLMKVDTASGKVIPDFAKGTGLHAVVPIPALGVLVTTNSGDASAKIISASDGALVASVPTGTRPDAAILDTGSGLVLVANAASGDVTVVDPKTRSAQATIKVGGALEYMQADNKGRLYINVEDKNEIAVVDIAARNVIARYPLPGCDGPSGLALVTGGRLISSCGNGVATIVSAATGKLFATLKIGKGPDAVLYDPVRKLAYIPCGRDGVLEVIALSGKADNTVIDTVPTQTGARTGAVDLKSGRIYLPTARYDAPAIAGQRPKARPGTFEILVLDR